MSTERSYLLKQILVDTRNLSVEEKSVSRLGLLGKGIAIAAFAVEITKKMEYCVEYHDFSEILKIFLLMVQKNIWSKLLRTIFFFFFFYYLYFYVLPGY